MAAAAKAKLIALATAGLLVAGVTGTIAYNEISGPGTRTRQVRVDPAASTPRVPTFGNRPPSTLQADPQWQAKFDAAYALKDGELARRVAPPFVPARLQFYRNWSEPQFQAIPRGPDMMILAWDGKTFHVQGMTFGGAIVSYVLDSTLQIQTWDIVGDDAIMTKRVFGDFVTRAGADPAQLRAAVLAELSKAVGRPLKMQQQNVERDVIVVRGKLQIHPATTRPYPGMPRQVVVLYRGTTLPAHPYFGGNRLTDRLASLCNRPVVVEGPSSAAATSLQVMFDGSAYPSARRGSPEEAQQIDELLTNVAKQTSLQFSHERRVLPTWMLTKSAATAPAATQPVAAAAATR